MKASFELEPHEIQRMIELAAPEYGREKALQEQLSKTYNVEEAADRLSRCSKTVLKLIKENRIRYKRTGKKGYSISELACREYMGDIKEGN